MTTSVVGRKCAFSEKMSDDSAASNGGGDSPAAAVPTCTISLKVKGGRGIQTADRPTPSTTVSLSLWTDESIDSTEQKDTSTPSYSIDLVREVTADSDTVAKLLANPLKITIKEKVDKGKAGIETQTRGTVTLPWNDLIFWKEQSEADEMAGLVSRKGWVPVEGCDGGELEVEISMPERIVSSEVLSQLNVLTLTVHALHNLPTTWCVGEGGDAAAANSTFAHKLTFSLPSSFGQETCHEVSSFTLIPPKPAAEGDDPSTAAGECLSAGEFSASTFLNSSASHNLIAAIKARKPIPFEISRFLKSGAAWPYTRRYKGVANISLTPLLVPGTTSAELQGNVKPAEDAHGALTAEETALITAATDPKSKKAPDFKPEAEPDAEAPHHYDAASTQLRISISLINPLVPKPPEPPKPLPRVQDLIQVRTLNKVKPPEAPSEAFSAAVRTIVDEIAMEFGRMFLLDSAEPLTVDGHKDRRQQLAFHLNTSGQYFQFKERLKEASLRIIRENFTKDKDQTPEQVKELVTSVYTSLTKLLNKTLNDKFAPGKQAPPDPAATAQRIKDCRAWAEEAEMVGNYSKALQMCAQCVVLDGDSCELWYTYGALCMRRNDLAKAEECFRAALAICPTDLNTLTAYGSLLMIREKPPQAKVFFVAAVEGNPASFLAWAALGLFYEMEGDDAERRKCTKKVLQMEAETGAVKRSMYIRAADYLVTIKATQMVERALAEEMNHNGTSVDLLLLLARTYLEVLDIPRARGYLEDILTNHDKKNGPALCMMGHTYYIDKRVREAISSYEKCLALRHAHVEAKELYQLGCLYLQTQKFYEAADIFSRGCTFKSSAEMWLGLGKALFLRNELAQAETALAEANVIDSHNPEVWAWLALTALRSNNINEAQAAFTEAIKNNLELPVLYRDIGRGFLKAGQVAVAEQSIKRAIAMLPEDALCQKLLGDCLAEQVLMKMPSFVRSEVHALC
jgi:tetratricopeptide (TPR) repeat protein